MQIFINIEENKKYIYFQKLVCNNLQALSSIAKMWFHSIRKNTLNSMKWKSFRARRQYLGSITHNKPSAVLAMEIANG